MSFWKNHWRKIYLGLIAYLVSFAIGIVNAQIMGVDFSQDSEAPTPVWIVGILAQIPIMALFALWYFASSKIMVNAKEGLRFGLACIIIGFIVDVLIIIPSILFSSAPADIGAYYGNIFFWITLVVTLVVPALVGLLRSNRS